MASPLWRAPRLTGDIRATISIEFALLAPVLLALLFGLISFGLQYSARIALTYAAAEGGRAALAGTTDAQRLQLAHDVAMNTLNALYPLIDTAHLAIAPVAGDDSIGHGISLTLTYDETRFARFPFVPAMSNPAIVTVTYYVSDPG